ncbi:autophagy-related protein 16-1-like [Clavelina lepadiformis]|uniref:autophagy-related protein 16-1-like n=1 Tax=Clavelina lepadiformis TaxID=159417 RepID=UPI0040419196
MMPTLSVLDENNMDSDYKNVVLKQLEERNKLFDKFSELINSHSSLYESNKELKKANLQYKVDIEKVKDENQDLCNKVQTGVSVAERSEQFTALEQKLFKVQEELTEVHRTKGARAQQIIDLNLALQEKEKEASSNIDVVCAKDEMITALKAQVSSMEQELNDLKQANQTVNDEYQALNITYLAIEEKLKKCQLENRNLIERWMNLKHVEAQALNTENNQFKRTTSTKAVSLETQSETSQSATRRDSASSPQASPSAQSSLSPPVAVTLKQRFSDFFSGRSLRHPDDEIHSGHALGYASTHSSAIVCLPQEAVSKWAAHENEVTATRFSLSGGRLATGGSDRLIHLWTFAGDKSRLQYTLRGCNGGVTSIDFDPQEQCLAAGCNDYSTKVFSLITQRLKVCLTGHNGKVLSSRFLGSQVRLASGGSDRTVKVWDLKTGGCTRTFMAGSSCNEIVAVDSADCLASGHFDRKIRVWDIRAGSHAVNEIDVSGRVTSLDMPLDKTSMICCTKDHTLELVDLRKASVLKVFSDDSFRVATDQTRCAFSTDGRYVCGLSSDGSVLSWDVDTGSLATCTREHNDPVISCCWIGGRLVTGDKNKQCILWSDS